MFEFSISHSVQHSKDKLKFNMLMDVVIYLENTGVVEEQLDSDEKCKGTCEVKPVMNTHQS